MRTIIQFLIATCSCFVGTVSVSAQNGCESMGWANLNGQSYVGPISGGGNSTAIQVTTFAQLKSAVESSGAKVIYVMNDVGNGYKGKTGDVLNVASDKTIVGYKPGITVKCSWQIKRASNVIVRNLICRGPGNSNSEQNWDCVNIEDSRRIWFDHCTIMEGEDGNFDVVKGSDNVTVTWCKFTYVTGGDHNLSNLIGSSDNETQSHGKLNVTYAYCWWDNVNSRCPRTRYGKIHVLNSYYNNVGSGAYAGKMSNIRVEGCFFENNVSNPTGLISTNGEAGVFVIDCNRGSTKTDGYNTPFIPPYQYEKFPVGEVKSKITDAGCGAGPTLDSPSDCGCYNQPIVDCNGVENGTAYEDECEECVGGNTGKTACVLDCNGDKNGSAIVDDCGICVGGNSGNVACSDVLQGEGFCSGAGVPESDNTGYQGDGYFNFDNVVGSNATWYLNSTNNQAVKLHIRYANGGTTNRPASININGSTQTTINGSPSGAWTTWVSESVAVNLIKGVNTLTITATSADGGPNIDLIALPNSVVAGSCTADCFGTIGGSASLDLCGQCTGGNTGIEPNALCVQEPFNSTAHPIPGKIEAEEYDLGGEGIAYHEANSNGNQGGGTLRNDEVDIEVCTDSQGGFNVGYTLTGEWLEYTVEVANTGNYDLELRLAKDGDGGLFHIEMDDVDITGPIEVPNTGGWQIWETIKLQDLSLTAGEHIMKIVFDSDYTNINYMIFSDLVTSAMFLANQEVTVFPNPFGSDGFQINKPVAYHYRIANTAGVVLEEGEGIKATKVGQSLASGLYILTVETDSEIITSKIIRD